MGILGGGRKTQETDMQENKKVAEILKEKIEKYIKLSESGFTFNSDLEKLESEIKSLSTSIHLNRNIKISDSLSSLCSTLNLYREIYILSLNEIPIHICDTYRQKYDSLDLSSLPIFSKRKIVNTENIFSWNDLMVLSINEDGKWELVNG